jgi:hypothetical protein
MEETKEEGVMFAHLIHAGSEIYLLSLKDNARHQSKSFAECCPIWPFVRKLWRKDGKGDAQNGGISYQPPRHALSVK